MYFQTRPFIDDIAIEAFVLGHRRMEAPFDGNFGAQDSGVEV